MSKQLLLLRHAKSDWSAGAPDFERPLNARGRGDAPRLGRWIAENDLLPEVVAVSNSARTLETLELLQSEFPPTIKNAAQIKIVETPALYHGGAAQIREAATAHLQTCARVLVVAHNPGMEDALREYCPDAPAFIDGKFMPTCALAVIALESADSRRGALRELLRPADL